MEKPHTHTKRQDDFFITEKKSGKSKSNFTKGQAEQPANKSTFVRKAPNIKKFNNKPDESVENPQKRPFDKRKWREQKYSKKFKLGQYEEKRKHILSKHYQRQAKKDNRQKLNVSEIYEKYSEDIEQENNASSSLSEVASSEVSSQNFGKFKKRLSAKEQFEQIKEEKKLKREEFLRKKQEKEEAIAAYKKKKAERYKKLSRKTKKGQPIMKERLELLLEKIQKSVSND